MHTYIVSGADRNTGEDVRREYTAPSAQDAEYLANQDGVMVDRVNIAQPAPTTSSSPFLPEPRKRRFDPTMPIIVSIGIVVVLVLVFVFSEESGLQRYLGNGGLSDDARFTRSLRYESNGELLHRELYPNTSLVRFDVQHDGHFYRIVVDKSCCFTVCYKYFDSCVPLTDEQRAREIAEATL